MRIHSALRGTRLNNSDRQVWRWWWEMKFKSIKHMETVVMAHSVHTGKKQHNIILYKKGTTWLNMLPSSFFSITFLTLTISPCATQEENIILCHLSFTTLKLSTHFSCVLFLPLSLSLSLSSFFATCEPPKTMKNTWIQDSEQSLDSSHLEFSVPDDRRVNIQWAVPPPSG